MVTEKPKTPHRAGFRLKVAPRFELGDGGFADLCLTTWLCYRKAFHLSKLWEFHQPPSASLPDRAFQIGVKFGLNHLELEKCAKF
jgi:hypothetical protein